MLRDVGWRAETLPSEDVPGARSRKTSTHSGHAAVRSAVRGIGFGPKAGSLADAVTRGVVKAMPWLRSKPWRWYWPLVLAWICGVYGLVHLAIPRVLSGGLNIYLAQPLIWTSLTLLAAIGWKLGLRSRPAPTRQLVVVCVLVGLFQVALFVIAGLLYGFGHSPYGHSPIVVLGNLLYVGTILIATELSRAYLVRLFGRPNPGLGVAVTAFIFAYVSIPLAKYASLSGTAAFMRFTGETLLPTLSENLLATFVAFLGGPVASIAYRGVLLAFEWLSPITPDLTWIVSAFIGTAAPALGLLGVRNQLAFGSLSQGGLGARDKGPSTGWVVAVALATALLWFNTGLFGYRPTLVSGVSMEPALVVGDIVITREVQADQVQVGDIIRYRLGNFFIVHRVVDLDRQGGSAFITRGDSNNTPDAPVSPAQLDGKVILVIPKLGWLSIGVRNLLSVFG